MALFIIERSGRRPLLLAAIFIDLLGVSLMAIADFFSPSQISGVLGGHLNVWHVFQEIPMEKGLTKNVGTNSG